MFWYLVGLIDLGIWVRIFFFLFVFVLDFRIEMVQGCYVINFTICILCYQPYLRCWMLLLSVQQTVTKQVLILLHISYVSYFVLFLFEYRTSSRCFFTYILFEFSSTIYTQGHNIIFSLLQILFLPVVYAIPSSLFSHDCFSYSNIVTLIA